MLRPERRVIHESVEEEHSHVGSIKEGVD
jgi:hypothetical protein